MTRQHDCNALCHGEALLPPRAWLERGCDGGVSCGCRHWATTTAYRMDLAAARSGDPERVAAERSRFMTALEPLLNYDGPKLMITDSQVGNAPAASWAPAGRHHLAHQTGCLRMVSGWPSLNGWSEVYQCTTRGYSPAIWRRHSLLWTFGWSHKCLFWGFPTRSHGCNMLTTQLTGDSLVASQAL
jgi:hypothetical protein